MINNHFWGPEFNKKEAEIRKLKAELERIDAKNTRPTLFTQTQSTLVPPSVFETYSPFHTPPRPQPKPSSPEKSKSKVKISKPKSKANSSSSIPPIPPGDSPKATPEPPKKTKDQWISIIIILSKTLLLTLNLKQYMSQTHQN